MKMNQNDYIEFDGLKFIILIYKLIQKSKKLLIINFIFVSLFFIAYLLITKSFKNNFNIGKEVVILTKEVPLRTKISQGLEDKNIACNVNSINKVYEYSKSNSFMNKLYEEKTFSYKLEKEEMFKNYKIEKLSENSFRVNFKSDNRLLIDQVLKDFPVILNKELERESSSCNKVLKRNLNYYYIDRLNEEELERIISRSPLLQNFLLPSKLFFVEYPVNPEENSFERSSTNAHLIKSIYLYILLIFIPLVYKFVKYKLGGYILDEEGFKKNLPYTYLGNLYLKNKDLNKIIIKNELNNYPETRKIGICNLTRNNQTINYPFDEIFTGFELLSIDYKDMNHFKDIDILILIVSPFDIKTYNIKELTYYLERFNNIKIGYFYF